MKNTLVVTLRERMRADILSGRLSPGQHLPCGDLSERYSVSVGVTREALAWLSARGLVTAEAHHGFQVTQLTRSGLEQLLDARMLLEPAILKESVRSGDTAWEGLVLSTHHVLSRMPQPGLQPDPDDGWATAHASFHDTLLSACGNYHLLGIVRGIDEVATLYRRWTTPDETFSEREAAEHLALRDLAIARDAEGAARVLGEHIAHQLEGRHDRLTGDL